MTRQEFNSKFAATQDTVEGFTDEQLVRINDAVFAGVADLELDGEITEDHLKTLFDRELSR